MLKAGKSINDYIPSIQISIGHEHLLVRLLSYIAGCENNSLSTAGIKKLCDQNMVNGWLGIIWKHSIWKNSIA